MDSLHAIPTSENSGTAGGRHNQWLIASRITGALALAEALHFYQRALATFMDPESDFNQDQQTVEANIAFFIRDLDRTDLKERFSISSACMGLHYFAYHIFKPWAIDGERRKDYNKDLGRMTGDIWPDYRELGDLLHQQLLMNYWKEKHGDVTPSTMQELNSVLPEWLMPYSQIIKD